MTKAKDQPGGPGKLEPKDAILIPLVARDWPAAGTFEVVAGLVAIGMKFPA